MDKRNEKEDCMTCVSFTSFREAYDDDPMEPNDQGFCHDSKSQFHYNEGAGAGVVCFCFKRKEKKIKET